jgi:hypothetical protein
MYKISEIFVVSEVLLNQNRPQALTGGRKRRPGP